MKLPEKDIIITAHAGCMNTKNDSLESVYAGIDAGADIIETDIRFTPDEIPVLSHDPIDGEQKQGVVTLQQVFEVVKGHPEIFMNLDIKEAERIEPLHKLIFSMNMEDRIILTGIEPQYVEPVQKKCPGITYLLNYDPDPSKILMNNLKYISGLVGMTIDSKAIGINLYYLFATEMVIEKFHEAGMKVFVWTVDDREDLDEMIRRKVDSITSNRIDLLSREIGAYNRL